MLFFFIIYFLFGLSNTKLSIDWPVNWNNNVNIIFFSILQLIFKKIFSGKSESENCMPFSDRTLIRGEGTRDAPLRMSAGEAALIVDFKKFQFLDLNIFLQLSSLWKLPNYR